MGAAKQKLQYYNSCHGQSRQLPAVFAAAVRLAFDGMGANLADGTSRRCRHYYQDNWAKPRMCLRPITSLTLLVESGIKHAPPERALKELLEDNFKMSNAGQAKTLVQSAVI